MPYADPAAKRANDAAYRAANRALLAAKQSARYHAGDKAAAARAAREWLASHPVQAKAIRYCNRANARARQWSDQPLKLSAARLYREVPLSWGCAYCGGDADTWDHAVPLCLGGPNAVENLNPTCTPCNRKKGRKKVAALWRPMDLIDGTIARILA